MYVTMSFLAMISSCLASTIHVTGPEERQVEFGDGTTSFATLSGGQGYINSTVTVNAPDLVTMSGTSVNEMMTLIRDQQATIAAQQAEIGALKTFVGFPESIWSGGFPFRVSCIVTVSNTASGNSQNVLLGQGFKPYMNLYMGGETPRMLLQFNAGYFEDYFGYFTPLLTDVPQYYEFVMLDRNNYKSYVNGEQKNNTATASPEINYGTSSKERYLNYDTSSWLNAPNPVPDR